MGDLVDALELFVLKLQNLNHGLDFHKLKLLLVCDKHHGFSGAPKVLENIVFWGKGMTAKVENNSVGLLQQWLDGFIQESSSLYIRLGN